MLLMRSCDNPEKPYAPSYRVEEYTPCLHLPEVHVLLAAYMTCVADVENVAMRRLPSKLYLLRHLKPTPVGVVIISR